MTFDKDMTLYAVWYPHYKVIEGAGSEWVKDSGAVQRFVADGNYKYFKELRIDGVAIIDGVKIYAYENGSTAAEISAEVMQKLSVGEHTITFVYTFYIILIWTTLMS